MSFNQSYSEHANEELTLIGSPGAKKKKTWYTNTLNLRRTSYFQQKIGGSSENVKASAARSPGLDLSTLNAKNFRIL
jgi:hypothetical protein